MSERTVESMCAQVFQKLDLVQSPDLNRRVLAVRMLLEGERLGLRLFPTRQQNWGSISKFVQLDRILS